MADSEAFRAGSEELESLCDLNRLEARGTLRIAVRTAGFPVDSVSSSDLAAIVRELMPAELEARGINDSRSVCEAVARFLERLRPDGPEEAGSVFARLGGSS